MSWKPEARPYACSVRGGTVRRGGSCHLALFGMSSPSAIPPEGAAMMIGGHAGKALFSRTRIRALIAPAWTASRPLSIIRK